MRGAVDGLPTPSPLLHAVPAIYLQLHAEGDELPLGEPPDDQPAHFLERFLSAFDDSLAPVISTLDNLPAYVDPHLAPADFVRWLATWVARPFGDDVDEQQLRALVAGAVSLHRARGTGRGIVAEVQLAVGHGASVELVESGATAWSAAPGGPLPGDERPHLLVRVRVDRPAEVDLSRVDALVRAIKPAHVPHRVEVLAR